MADCTPTAAVPPNDILRDFRTDWRVLVLSLMAVPVGAAGAAVAKALMWLIAVITNGSYFLRWSSDFVPPDTSRLGVWSIAVPVAGSLVIGLMARFGSEKIRGHGIPEALEAILQDRSVIGAKVAILKPISSAIAIGTGGPFGAEGPIIMTGGAVGSIFAQFFHLTPAERKTLLVAGAAAGMSAVFAAPIAAILLSVELLLFEWKPRSLIPVTVASVFAAVLRIPILGIGPIFPVPPHPALSSGDLGIALVVGIVTGFGSGGLTYLVYACEDLFRKLPLHWMWWPVLGGLAVGIGGLVEPQALGVGYAAIHGLMLGRIVGTALILLVVVKALIWAFALGSGTSGGVLAPLLMIGGAIGALCGIGLGIGDPGLWAMVGMAGMMGGTMRSPLTGMIFILELSHDINALPAFLVGSVGALCVTVLMLRRSILTEKLARRGRHVAREYSVDVFEMIRVGDVMDRNPPTIPAETTVADLSDRISRGDPGLSRRQGTVVVDAAGKLAGMVTRGDLLRVIQKGAAEKTTVLQAGDATVPVTFPDETVQDALSRMLAHGLGRLPVVDRSNDRAVVGYLGREEILATRTRLQAEEELRERGPLAEQARHRLWR